jgi:hypothetical protein
MEITITGTLSIFQKVSRVNGTLIIERNGGDPVLNATNDLQTSGFQNGSPITVTGTQDQFKGEPAINMTSAQPAAGNTSVAAFAAPKKGGAKKAGAKSAAGKKASTGRKASTKKAVKKSVKKAAKKGAIKKR